MTTNFRRHARLLVLPLLLAATASANGQNFSLAQRAPGPADVAEVRLNRPAKAVLADQRRLASALAALQPQRPGVVDAYVVVAGLDSDGVFGREAREAGRVLSRRYAAAGRTVVLTADEEAAPASPTSLAAALARVGELADAREDVLVLYATAHGSAQAGLAYRDVRRGAGAIPPARLAAMLDEAGVANRLLIVSACYSGVFVPRLAGDKAVVITAAASDRASFGCGASNDWTYWGDALVNRALRKAQPLSAAFAEAAASVARWEAADGSVPSNPQISVGRGAARWLAPLEKRIPAAATQPVGRSPAQGA